MSTPPLASVACESRIIDDVGHLVPIERPRAAADLILSFLHRLQET